MSTWTSIVQCSSHIANSCILGSGEITFTASHLLTNADYKCNIPFRSTLSGHTFDSTKRKQLRRKSSKQAALSLVCWQGSFCATTSPWIDFWRHARKALLQHHNIAQGNSATSRLYFENLLQSSLEKREGNVSLWLVNNYNMTWTLASDWSILSTWHPNLLIIG